MPCSTASAGRRGLRAPFRPLSCRRNFRADNARSVAVPPRILNVRTAYKGWATISLATIEGENGDMYERLVEDHGPSVCVLPVDRKRHMAMLVRQFRAPVCVTSGKSDLLECPAGLADDQPAEEAVRRELVEETGLHLNNVHHV